MEIEEIIHKITKVVLHSVRGGAYMDKVEQLANYIKEQENIKIQSQQEESQKLREAMQWFVDRCDNGEVRSKKTYARFKELLNK